MQKSPAPVDRKLLGEAADWIMLLRSHQVGEAERLALEQWRERSPAHQEAWRRAETVMQTFGGVPVDIRGKAVRSLHAMNRRHVLGMLLMAAPVGLIAGRALPWSHWTADAATAKGQRRVMHLADGSTLVLNTQSAIDTAFTQSERRLRLRAGEVLITTGRDSSSSYRPFFVATPHGNIRALGTRFSVRMHDDQTRVIVFEDSVEIVPERGAAVVLRAGEQSAFDASVVHSVVAADVSAAAWEKGMLVAKGRSLADVTTELARYRPGILRCDPSVAALPVSGTFSLDDTDSALRLLASHLPVRIEQGLFWTTIVAR